VALERIEHRLDAQNPAERFRCTITEKVARFEVTCRPERMTPLKTSGDNGQYHSLRSPGPGAVTEEHQPLLANRSTDEELELNNGESSSTMARTSSVDEDSRQIRDGKMVVSHLDGPTPARLPDALASMSPADRQRLELHLRRKIDLRLLPMVILMYIMNYLDRNNIASARIAGPNGKGLQDELKLSSTQYQVSLCRITRSPESRRCRS
jgi:hypothetical protein